MEALQCSLHSLCVESESVSHQATLSMEFSRQEYWSRLPFPSPGDLPYPGLGPGSPALRADSLLSRLQGKPNLYRAMFQIHLNKTGMNKQKQNLTRKESREDYSIAFHRTMEAHSGLMTFPSQSVSE